MSTAQLSKSGRNDPCPCGSGKKFKHCCLQTVSAPINRHPINFEEINRHAQLAASQGNFAEAVLVFRQLLTIKPHDAYVLASLGQSLCWLHKRREGLHYLLQAARKLEKAASKTLNTTFILELSNQLIHWGEIPAAERLARLAIKLEPNSPIALNNLVVCLTRVNRNSEALPLARRVCELLPDHPACGNLLGIVETSLGNRIEARKIFERIIALDRDNEQTARAYLELANLHDKLGNYGAAFAAARQSAELNAGLAKNQAVSRDYLFSCVSINKAGFEAELLNRWSAATLIDDGLPAPAFLVGFLRSGTTLTEQVLATHPDIIATDESSIVNELTQELAAISKIQHNIPAALKKLDVQQIKYLRHFFWQRLREELGDSVMVKQLVDKNALNTIDLGLISVVFPEAKILFAVRDPRDICISCFMQSFTATPATINLLSWEGVVRQYATVMDYWLYLKDSMQPNYLQLKYEDTIADFETSYRQVFEFLGVNWTPEVTRFHEHAKKRYISTPSFAAVSQPIYKNAVARWKNYERHLQPVMPTLLRFIQEYGYPES